MFGQLGNLASLVKQAQSFGSRLGEMKDELRARRIEGSAGGGLVTVEVNGLQEVLSCRIDPSLLNESGRELLEELVRGATNDALTKARQANAEAMQSLAGGMNIPGLEEALGGIGPSSAGPSATGP